MILIVKNYKNNVKRSNVLACSFLSPYIAVNKIEERKFLLKCPFNKAFLFS